MRSVAIGRGLGKPLQLEHLPHNSDVRVGDLLVTSGLGGRFPVGYPVGTVGSIKHPPGKTFSDITVKPAANLETSREVLLVLATAGEVDTVFDDEEIIDSDEATVESDEPVVSIESEGAE